MIRCAVATLAVCLPLFVFGCETGPYDPAAHHHADASTGSMLSGTDAGADGNANLNNDTAVGSNHFVPK